MVTITPTYSGCPALREIAHDLRHRLSRAGFAEVTVRTALAPAWSSDWITAEGRRKLQAAGIAPPQPVPAQPRPDPPGPGPAHPHRPPRAGPVPALRIPRYNADRGVQRDRVQGAVPLRGLPRALRIRKGNLMAAPARRPGRVPPAHRDAGRPADGRLRRGDLRGAARAGGQVRLRARAVGDHPPRRRAAVLLDLRRRRAAAAHRRAGGAGRRSVRLARARGPGRRRDRRAGAIGLVHPRSGHPRAPRPDRRGQRDHARLVHRRIRARRPGQIHGHPALRQPAQRLGDVRRRDRRPQGRLPGADLPGPRAQPRAAGSRAVQRPARRRQAALAAAGHRRRSGGGPLVAVRPVRHGRRRDRGTG